MLSSRQISQLAKLIEARRLALEDELGEEADRNDPVEAADTERDIGELRELEAAAERIAAGRYGSCVDCAAAIDFERLFARPGVTRCIACQRRHEKTHAGPERASL